MPIKESGMLGMRGGRELGLDWWKKVYTDGWIDARILYAWILIMYKFVNHVL